MVPQTTEQRSARQRFAGFLARGRVAVVLGLVVILLAVLTVLSTVSSFETRSDATALADARLATISALDIDATTTLSAEDNQRLTSNITTLEQSRPAILGALDGEDQLNATDELDLLLGHLRRIGAGETLHNHEHNIGQHESFERVIRSSAVTADAEATRKERISTAYAIAAFLAILGFAASRIAAKSSRVTEEAEVEAYRLAAERYEMLSRTDDLTGVLNRRALMQQLAAIDSSGALLMVDLDDFKRVNDTRGHHCGDEVLKTVARRLETEIGEGETLFRLGGDEFAVLSNRDDDEYLETLASRLVGTLVPPVPLDSGDEDVTPSIGIAKYEGPGSERSLLRRADIAMYEAKSLGGSSYCIVRPELERRAGRGRALASGLASADMDAEFRLVYQPIVASTTGRVEVVEALARWTSPDLGVVTPDEFIACAEGNGRIASLGLWIVDRALRDLISWRAQGSHVRVAVNVSAHQLLEPTFVPRILGLFEAHGRSPDDMVIEVTESALVGPEHVAVERLAELRSAGCTIACDDFGSGYANLGQLLALPLDIIKIDAQLLNRLSRLADEPGDGSAKERNILRAIVAIGDSMSAAIVAEGVETTPQEVALRAAGIDLMQGYLFSRPIEADRIPQALASPAWPVGGEHNVSRPSEGPAPQMEAADVVPQFQTMMEDLFGDASTADLFEGLRGG